MKKILIYFTGISLILLSWGCDRMEKENPPFDNVVYIENALSVFSELVIVKPDIRETKSFRASSAETVNEDVGITYKIAPEMVNYYNSKNNTEYELLPDMYYTLPADMTTIIPAGQTRSTATEISFLINEDFPHNKTYILPVSMSQATGIPILEGSQTLYYLIRRASLIYTAPNITRSYFPVPNVGRRTTFTMEGLFRFNQFKLTPVDDTNICSVFGTESVFLVRIGDGDDKRQMELVTSAGKITGPIMETDRWYHIAATFDNDAKRVALYLDGDIVNTLEFAEDVSLNLNAQAQWADLAGFHLGGSWNGDRWMFGEMCEVRLWNVARTRPQLVANRYLIEEPELEDDLIAYWKCDEGQGNVLHDSSVNGLDVTGVTGFPGTPATITWVDVELPPATN